MPNRSKAPSFTTSFDISLGEISQTKLSTGQTIWHIPADDSEITRIDVIFPSGRRNETRKGQSRLCIKTVTEGSKNMSGDNFNEKMDFHGAVCQSSAGMDYTSFSLIAMKQHLPALLPIWLEMILNPVFPAKNIGQKKNLAAEQLKRELAKNSVVAYRELTAHIFGKDHPYGYNTEPKHYQALNSEHLLDFYNANISIAQASFIISGNIPKKLDDSLEKFCKKSESQASISKPILKNNYSIIDREIEGLQDNQYTLRFGRRLFEFDHDDSRHFQLLNLVLGGYFGSRLIKNLREEKGFCYHIDSTVDTMKDDGYFSISADINPENVQATQSEIIKEINILRSELIPEEEFRIVKNYLKGQLLTFIDGPFAKASLLRNYLVKGSNPLYFNSLSKDIEETTREDILNMAIKYLDPEQLNKIVVGK